MKKEKLPSAIQSNDYQTFAKKKKAKLFDVPTDATQYQQFVYDKENIPEAARMATKAFKSKANAEIEAAETQEMIAKAKAKQIPPEKKNSAIKEKKALSLEEQIKNPTKQGEKDNQIGFRKIKGKLQFYIKVGSHEVPFDVEKYGGKDILDDATSDKYREAKEKEVREYEKTLNENSKPTTDAEKKAAAKATESSIAD